MIITKEDMCRVRVLFFVHKRGRKEAMTFGVGGIPCLIANQEGGLFMEEQWKMQTEENPNFAIIDNYLCIRMPREVDHHGAAGIRENADRLLLNERVRNIVFDFENTSFMDGSGIGIIIGRYRKISSFGGKVYAIHADERIQRILKASGMTSIIEVLS